MTADEDATGFGVWQKVLWGLSLVGRTAWEGNCGSGWSAWNDNQYKKK